MVRSVTFPVLRFRQLYFGFDVPLYSNACQTHWCSHFRSVAWCTCVQMVGAGGRLHLTKFFFLLFFLFLFQKHYPKHTEEVTTEWLAKLMQKNITAHDIVKVLEAGSEHEEKKLFCSVLSPRPTSFSLLPPHFLLPSFSLLSSPFSLSPIFFSYLSLRCPFVSSV